jgi:hypothetical protein
MAPCGASIEVSHTPLMSSLVAAGAGVSFSLAAGGFWADVAIGMISAATIIEANSFFMRHS